MGFRRHVVFQQFRPLKPDCFIFGMDAGKGVKFLDDAKAKGEGEEKEFKSHLKEVIRETIEEMGLATKEDIEALKKEMKK